MQEFIFGDSEFFGENWNLMNEEQKRASIEERNREILEMLEEWHDYERQWPGECFMSLSGCAGSKKAAMWHRDGF